MGEESAGQVTAYPAEWTPKTHNWMLFQGECLDSGFPLPTLQPSSWNPYPPPARCELLQSKAEGWEGVWIRVCVHLCVPVPLNLCLYMQICVYAGLCLPVSLNIYVCLHV